MIIMGNLLIYPVNAINPTLTTCDLTLTRNSKYITRDHIDVQHFQ